MFLKEHVKRYATTFQFCSGAEYRRERGMDKLAVLHAELFLQIALTSPNRNTRKRVPHVAPILTHQDAAAAVSLANPATRMTSISRCCYGSDLFELGHNLVALTFFGDLITKLKLVEKMGN